MPNLRRPLVLSAILLALCGLALPALGQQRGGADRSQGQPAQGHYEGDGHDHESELAEAVRRIEREQRGQVLSAERIQYEGREVSRIKVIDERGRVRVYTDDPHAPGANTAANDPPRRER